MIAKPPKSLIFYQTSCQSSIAAKAKNYLCDKEPALNPNAVATYFQFFSLNIVLYYIFSKSPNLVYSLSVVIAFAMS